MTKMTPPNQLQPASASQPVEPQAASTPQPIEPQPAPVQAAPPPAAPPARPKHAPRIFIRFDVWQRVEHFVMLLAFSLLAITGLPQKFATAPISQTIIELFGGIESTRIIHHYCAVIMIVLSVYHVIALIYRVFVRRVSWTMFPGIEDARHVYHDVLFYIGRRKHRAFYGRYNYGEKMEYLAVVWGTFVMIITGFMMWNPIATTNVLSGQIIPAAKAAHGGEAVLAVLAIILWHFYNVHLRHFNKSMFTGKLTRREMQHEHPAELALLDEGKAVKEVPAAVLRRRQRVFLPVAAVLVIISGISLFQFLTFEKTAIDTVPPAIAGKAFVPYTPTSTLRPSPTPAPTETPTPGAVAVELAGEAWDTTIGELVNTQCAACHINAAMGDLSLKTYADALKGGKSGPAIVPNDPNKSVLVQIQQKGGHAGQLSASDLAKVVAWIKAGAPQQSGSASAATPSAVATPPTTAESWPNDIAQLITDKCAACHVKAAMGDLSLKTYADALKGGKSGPAIVPNDPDKSVLVQVQKKGGHAGQFLPEELDRVIAWIKAGAPGQNSSATPTATVTTTVMVEGWTGGIDQLINARCATCHVTGKLGDLSLKTRADALAGGKTGPAIVPYEPDRSVLVQVQSTGDHAGQFSGDELARIVAWIKGGAPEQGGALQPPATDGWTGVISQIINTKCAFCHIQDTQGGLSLASYGDALAGGYGGPAVMPNSPDQSMIVAIQSDSGHPVPLSRAELDRVIAWIKAGAPEQGTGTMPPLEEATAITSSSANAWTGGVDQLITAKCAACHVKAAMGNLSLKTYAEALKGGKSGAAIVPNDPDKSVLVQVQQKGGHAGQFSQAELDFVIAWIKAGAPEKAEAAVSATAGEAWAGGIDQLVMAKCAACHVKAAMGNLSLKTYAEALKGGKSGAAIVPNDPDKSVLVQVQQKGGHAGQFSQAELDRIIAWIKAGAPEQGGAAATPPAAIESWADGIVQLMTAKCAACHVKAAMGNLSLKTYAEALKGGKSGAAIVPNDPDKSVLVQVQKKGGHAGQFSQAELDRIIAWIKAGAPEQGGAAATPPAATESWTDGIAQLMTAKCAACHVKATMGNFSLKAYNEALKGGKSGPAIVPNDPAKSVLVQVQQKGGHAGQFSQAELDRIIAWIKAGAPEK